MYITATQDIPKLHLLWYCPASLIVCYIITIPFIRQIKKRSLTRENFMSKSIKLHNVSFTIDHLSENEKVLLIQLTHLLNEIMILNKCIVYSSNGFNSSQGALLTAKRVMSLLFIKFQSLKLWEGWQLIQKIYHGTSISKDLSSKLSSNATKALDDIKRYMSKENTLSFIRDNYAAHFETDDVLRKEINSLNKDTKLQMLASDESGNTLYDFSDTIVNMSLVRHLNPSEPCNALKCIFDEIIKVAEWFQDFGLGVFYALMDKAEFEIEEIKLADIPMINDVDLPYFLYKNKNEGL
jgi:hypothetical protein